MRISELIDKLETIRKTNGDMQVVFGNRDDEYGDWLKLMQDDMVAVKDIHMVGESTGAETGTVREMLLIAPPDLDTYMQI